MFDFLTLLQRLYAHRRRAFSRRFVALSVLLVIGAVWWVLFVLGRVGTHPIWLWLVLAWLGLVCVALFGPIIYWPGERRKEEQVRQCQDAMAWESAQALLDRMGKSRLRSPAFGVQCRLLQAALYRLTGNMHAALDELLVLRDQVLTSAEHRQLAVSQVYLFLQDGNYAGAERALRRAKATRLDDTDGSKWVLARSMLMQALGDGAQAKRLLESALEGQNLQANDRCRLLHQLGMLEAERRNRQLAVGYYEQAWQLIVSGKVKSFGQADRTAENLALTQLALGNVTAAHQIAQDFGLLADRHNVHQLVAVHNLRVQVARQLGHRQQLLAAYAAADAVIRPILPASKRLAFAVTTLQMSFNDGVDFDAALERATDGLQAATSDSGPLEQARALQQVYATVQAAFDVYGPRPDLLARFQWLNAQWQRLGPELDALRKTLPVALPGLWDEWFRLRLSALKAGIAAQDGALAKKQFDELFALLFELSRLWQNKRNPREQLEALIIVVDEYLAYADTLQSETFVADYQPMAHDILQQSRGLLNRHLGDVRFTDALVGLADQCSRFDVHKMDATAWLAVFDSRGLALAHYAVHFRQAYARAKAWVEQQS